MKPLKLHFQAFASYAEAADIDFESLDSLFLIHGETGAGKTAILDAMMYALYGESSGGERSELRCALPKAADIPTEVEFIFEVRGKKYKFTRAIRITPRSKQLKDEQDCFWFDEKTKQFRAFFENPKQAFVRKKAEELTGLSAEQFRQVVILPQGRFERLLTSDSKEKEEILSTLFAAEKYSRLSDKLYEKAEEERRVLDAEEAALKAILAGENAESPERLSEEIETLSQSMKEFSPKIEAAKNGLAKAREELTAAKLLSESFSQLSAAKERLLQLDRRSEEIGRIKDILSLHEKAMKAKPEYAAFSEAGKMLAVRSQSLSAAEAAFSAAEKEYNALAGKRKEISALENIIAAKTEELTLLNSLSEVYQRIGTAEEAVRKISAEYSGCEKLRANTESSLKKTEKEISEAAGKREKIISEFSMMLPSLRTRKAELERGEESAKELLRYEPLLKKIHADIEKFSAQAEAYERERSAAEGEYDRLYGLYIANAAAELSSQLKEGVPCPVCGSLSHPVPAAAQADLVTSEQVKAARDKFEQAAKRLSAVRESIAKEQARIPAAEEYLSARSKAIEETGYSPEALKEISERCAEAENQNASLAELDKWISSLNTQKQAFEENLKAAAERSESLKIRQAKAEAELSALRERLVPECPDQKAYVLRTSSLKKEIDAFAAEKQKADESFRAAEKRRIECSTAFEQAQKEHSAAAERAANAENAFLEKLSALGIAGREQYEGSLLSEELSARYSSDIERHSMERHSVSETVKSLSEKLKDTAPPELESIKAAADNAETLYRELSRQEAVAAERLSRLKKLSEEYSKRRAVYEAAREKSGKRIAFAKFMHGDKGISFTRYVLSIMLNLVVAEANRILAEIHGGMFRLCVKTELAANSKQGLDLEVENIALSSTVKYGVKNLSGGEKFLISLALSLGLSLVAQSRAGGIAIEAMFIDEGFGSLDPTSLEEAISILCELSAGRNTIGIISHVEELRTVIPCVIKVAKSTEGGSKIASG